MARSPRHRDAVDGGYQRGEATRAKIVAAALSLFGERGFDGASTRDIAERAGVNAPALGYYFDNKEGVYLACSEYIVTRVWAFLAAPVAAAQAVIDSDAGDDALIEAFCAIQASVAEYLFTTNEPDDLRLFMAREQAGMGPASAFDLIDKRVSERMLGVSAAIVGRLTGLPADDPETVVRALTLNGQLLPFHITRRTALRALGWETIDEPRLALLVKIINGQTAALLRQMTAKRASQKKSRVKKTERTAVKGSAQ